ncbi:MAG: tetratricopeptide repeat protein, partial [Planctomycetota bacterium]
MEYNGTAELQNLGLYEQATKRWEKYLEKYPDDDLSDKAAYYLGVCYLKQGRFADASETLETVLRKHPRFEMSDGARYHRAMALFRFAEDSERTDDFAAAAAAFSDLVANHSDSEYAARSHYYQGESLYAADRAEEAVGSFRELIRKYPGDELLADAYYSLGTAQQDLQDFAGAAATYGAFLGRKELAAHPLHSEIRLRLALSLYEQRLYEQAESAFGQVAELERYDFADFAMLRQAQCLAALDRLDDAAKAFTRLTVRFPRSEYASTARLSAGKCEYETGNYGQA